MRSIRNQILSLFFIVAAFVNVATAQDTPAGDTPNDTQKDTVAAPRPDSAALDIVFMVDNSGSIKKNDAGDMRIDMMKALVDFYSQNDYNGARDRFALIQYAGRKESEREGRKILWRELAPVTDTVDIIKLKHDIENLYLIPWGTNSDLSVAFGNGLKEIIQKKARNAKQLLALPPDQLATRRPAELAATNRLWVILFTDGVTEVFAGRDTPEEYLDYAKKLAENSPDIPEKDKALYRTLAAQRGFAPNVSVDEMGPKYINAAADVLLESMIAAHFVQPRLKYTPVSLAPENQISSGILNELAVRYSHPPGQVVNSNGRAFRDIFLKLLELRPGSTRPSIYDYQYDPIPQGDSATHSAKVYPGNKHTRIVVFCTMLANDGTVLDKAPAFDVTLKKSGLPIAIKTTGSGRYRIFNLDELGRDAQGVYDIQVKTQAAGDDTKVGFESTVFSEFDLKAVGLIPNHDDYSKPPAARFKLVREDDADQAAVKDPEMVKLLNANMVVLDGKLDATTMDELPPALTDYLFQAYRADGSKAVPQPDGFKFLLDKPLALNPDQPVDITEPLPIDNRRIGWYTILFTVQGIDKSYLEGDRIVSAGKALQRIVILKWYQPPLMDLQFSPRAGSVKDKVIGGKPQRIGFGNIRSEIQVTGAFASPQPNPLPNRVIVPVAYIGRAAGFERMSAVLTLSASGTGVYHGVVGIPLDKTLASALHGKPGELRRFVIDPSGAPIIDAAGKPLERKTGAWQIRNLALNRADASVMVRPATDKISYFEIEPLTLDITLDSKALIDSPLRIRADMRDAVADPTLLPDTIRIEMIYLDSKQNPPDTSSLTLSRNSTGLRTDTSGKPMYSVWYKGVETNVLQKLGAWKMKTYGVTDAPLAGWFKLPEDRARKVIVSPREFHVLDADGVELSELPFKISYKDKTSAKSQWPSPPFELKRAVRVQLQMMPGEPPRTVKIGYQADSQDQADATNAARQIRIMAEIDGKLTDRFKISPPASGNVGERRVDLVIQVDTDQLLPESPGRAMLTCDVADPVTAAVRLDFPNKAWKQFLAFLPYIIALLIAFMMLIYFLSIPSFNEQQFRPVLQNQPLNDVTLLKDVRYGFEKRRAGLLDSRQGEVGAFRLTGRKIIGHPAVIFEPVRNDLICYIHGEQVRGPYPIHHGDEILVEAPGDTFLRFRYFEHQPTPEEISSEAAPTFADQDIIIEGL